MSIFTEAAVVVLAMIAACCGVIGMIASITELVITRNKVLHDPTRQKEDDP